MLLYDAFNQTLWKMIEREGPGFVQDLALFKKLNEAMKKICLEGRFLTQVWLGKIVMGYAVKSNITKELQITCNKMIMNELPYLNYLREKLAKQQEAISSSINEQQIV